MRPSVDCDFPIVLQVKYDNLPGRRIHDPVFANTCLGILVKLEADIFFSGGGGEDLYDKVRSPIDPAVAKFVPVTYDQNVGLDDRILVIVQDNVNWRGQRNAGASHRLL